MKKLKKTAKKLIALFTMAFVLTAISNLIPALQTVNTVEAATLKLNTKNKQVYEGEEFTLKVLNLGKQTVKWSSSDKSVATVNKGGTVKAIKVGNATITGLIGSKKLSCKFTVIKEVINEPNLSVHVLDVKSKEMMMTVLIVTNYGDLPVVFNSEGFVYNEGSSDLNKLVYLYDQNSGKFLDLIDSVTVESGEDGDIWYTVKEYGNFWLDDDTKILFKFTYDGVEFTGETNKDGDFHYYQGFDWKE